MALVHSYSVSAVGFIKTRLVLSLPGRGDRIEEG